MVDNQSAKTPDDGPGGRRRRPPIRHVEVSRVESLWPRMVRVTFTGDDLVEFGWNGPAAHNQAHVSGGGPGGANAAATAWSSTDNAHLHPSPL